jgi:exopolysaccharide biosynthesis protein
MCLEVHCSDGEVILCEEDVCKIISEVASYPSFELLIESSLKGLFSKKKMERVSNSLVKKVHKSYKKISMSDASQSHIRSQRQAESELLEKACKTAESIKNNFSSIDSFQKIA